MKLQMQLAQYKYEKNEEINQEKIKFYMNISHELRTPLSLIIAPLEEIIKENYLLSNKMQTKLKYIYQNSRRLLHIINQLLAYRKAESGTLPLQVEMIDVENWCSQLHALFKDKAQKRNIDYLFCSELNHRLLPADKNSRRRRKDLYDKGERQR